MKALELFLATANVVPVGMLNTISLLTSSIGKLELPDALAKQTANIAKNGMRVPPTNSETAEVRMFCLDTFCGISKHSV